MKKQALILLLLTLFSCTVMPYKSWERRVRKTLRSHLENEPQLPTPPNTVWLESNVFIDKSEIGNLMYLEYLHYLNEDSSYNYYQSQIPMMRVWTDKEVPLADSLKLKLSLGYLEYEGFRFLPVVGVSHSQAQHYCKWRSKVVSRNFISTRDKKYKFTFRLPTEEEWEKATQITTDSLQKLNEYGFDTQKIDVSNFNLRKNLNDTSKVDFPPTKYIYEEPKNLLGLYQMIGNVAEMIDQEGISKGGSWLHVSLQSQIKRRIRYNSPTSWLGFRCVCEVEEVE